jgi:hypothetical protein
VNLALAALLGAGVLACGAILYGAYRLVDRLQTRAEQTHGRWRWAAIGLIVAVGVVALCTFWACFALAAGLMQALGLNLR